MKAEKYIGYELQLYFKLKEYLKENILENTCFYQLNKMNYYRLVPLIELLNEDDLVFLSLYYNDTFSLKEKLFQLNISKSLYYQSYTRILKRLKDIIDDDNI